MAKNLMQLWPELVKPWPWPLNATHSSAWVFAHWKYGSTRVEDDPTKGMLISTNEALDIIDRVYAVWHDTSHVVEWCDYWRKRIRELENG